MLTIDSFLIFLLYYMFDYINLKIFLISLALGIFAVYVTGTDLKVVHIYPQPDNISKVQYKDKAGQCFEYSANEVSCPSMPFSTSTIPIQS